MKQTLEYGLQVFRFRKQLIKCHRDLRFYLIVRSVPTAAAGGASEFTPEMLAEHGDKRLRAAANRDLRHSS